MKNYLKVEFIMENKKTIYSLCTCNSCRSQMAEGWAKKHLGVDWEVKNTGLEAHGLNTNACIDMQEAGIDISNQTSDIIDPDILNNLRTAKNRTGSG